MRHPVYHFLAKLVVQTDPFDIIRRNAPCDDCTASGVMTIRGQAFDFCPSSREEFGALFNRLVEFGMPDPGDDDLRDDWGRVLRYIQVLGSHECSRVALVCMFHDHFDLPFWYEVGRVFTPNYMPSNQELVRLRTFLARRAVPALMRRGDYSMMQDDAIEGLGNYLDRYDPLGRPLMAEMLRCLKLKVVPAVLVAVDED